MMMSRGFVLFALLMLVGVLFFPDVDLWIAALFYNPEALPGLGFPVAQTVWAEGLHEFIQWAARALGAMFLAGLVFTLIRRQALWGMDARAFAFLLLSLILVPGVLVNTVLKDEWGRARPRQVAEFGGDAHFTPALHLTDQCAKNCSFVSGDASLGFWFAAFAFVAARKWRQRVWQLGLGLGAGFGILRIMMGAHFFSDVLYAGFFVLLAVWGLARLMLPPSAGVRAGCV